MTCPNCGSITRIIEYLESDGKTFGVYFAELHKHGGRPEVFIDVILGTWGMPDQTPNDHVTFACRVGDVEGQESPGATLVQPRGENHPILGVPLSRDDALAHPLLGTFWAVVDFILVNDDKVRLHLYRG